MRKEPHQPDNKCHETSTLPILRSTNVSVHWYACTLHLHKTEKEYLLVSTDQDSKMTKNLPMNRKSTAEVTKRFVNTWVSNYGPPIDFLSDNGPCFSSKYYQDVCRIMWIQNNFTTSYHSQSNRKVELYNITVIAALRTYMADHPRDLNLDPDALTYTYNCKPKASLICHHLSS